MAGFLMLGKPDEPGRPGGAPGHFKLLYLCQSFYYGLANVPVRVMVLLSRTQPHSVS